MSKPITSKDLEKQLIKIINKYLNNRIYRLEGKLNVLRILEKIIEKISE